MFSIKIKHLNLRNIMWTISYEYHFSLHSGQVTKVLPLHLKNVGNFSFTSLVILGDFAKNYDRKTSIF